MNPADGDSPRRWRTLLPLLVVIIASMAIGVAATILAQVQPLAPITVAAPADNAPAVAEFFKERLELYDRRARDIQWILAALLATGALFTLLQGVFAYVSVNNFNASVDATLKKASDAAAKIDTSRSELEQQFRKSIQTVENDANARIEELRKKLEAQFPIAGRIEESLNDALWLLDGYFQDADWYEKLYEKLRPEQRQEIVFYEKVIAGFASLSLPRLDEPLARAFRGLGNFYTSKFKMDRDPDDLDRARFYFNRAIARSASEFVGMNMLGYIALTCLEAPDYAEAESQFKRSLSVYASQQRALYNLANIAYHRDKDFDTAVRYYREALEQKRWEYRVSFEDEIYIQFSLACVLALTWNKSNRKPVAEESLQLLEKTVQTGAAYVGDYLRKDCEPGGDLAGLRASPDYGQRLETILKLV